MLAPNNSNNQNIGDGLQVNAGRDAEVHYHEPPKPKSSAIQELLFNIIDIEKKESASLKDDDYRTYSIEDKIKFNSIKIYKKFLDKYKDGYEIVETRLQDLELNYTGDIRQLVINYVAKKYRLLSCQGYEPDKLIYLLDKEISDELKELYKTELNLDEIEHIDFVIFHVFVKCEIFDKPPLGFGKQWDVNLE